nr:hypothetical protein [Burkholderia cepacia]
MGDVWISAHPRNIQLIREQQLGDLPVAATLDEMNFDTQLPLEPFTPFDKQADLVVEKDRRRSEEDFSRHCSIDSTRNSKRREQAAACGAKHFSPSVTER